MPNDLPDIVDALPGLFWTSLPDGQVDFLNQQWCEFTGLGPDVARGYGWTAAISVADRPRLMEYWRSLLASGKPGEIEARLRRADGEDRWFLFRANPVRDESGNIVKWYGTNIDIDDRVQAETALRERELQYRSIVETIPGLVIVLTGAGIVEYANRRFLEHFAMTLEDLKGRTTRDAVHPDDLSEALAARNRSLETGAPYMMEYRLRRPNGTYCWFQSRGLPERDAAGAVTRWYILMTDIDEQKQREVEKERTDAFLAEAQRLCATGCFSWRAATDEFIWSTEAYRIYEVPQGAPLTFDMIAARLHPEDRATFRELIARATREGSDFEFEQRLQRETGSPKYLHVVARRVGGRDGALEYVGAVQDITDRRLSEQAVSKLRSELAHVTRISTLGALTASIAHEVNQPLSGVVMNTTTCLLMLGDEPPDLDGARETARKALRDGNRAAEVIARLRVLFRKGDTSTEYVNLNEAIQEVISLSESEIQGESATVRAELASDLPLVQGDRVQLQQVILNLLRNAIEAMSSVRGRPRRLAIKTEREADDRIRVSVRDAGTGFEARNVEKLFEAFYTTKSTGMGLGLCVSRSIIESHRGALWGSPNDGPGATFTFSIPCVHLGAGTSTLVEAAR